MESGWVMPSVEIRKEYLKFQPSCVQEIPCLNSLHLKITVKNPSQYFNNIFIQTAIFAKKLARNVALFHIFVNIFNVCLIEDRHIIMFLHSLSYGTLS